MTDPVQTLLDGAIKHMPSIRALLGCSWGHQVYAPDDAEPCYERAVQIVIVHRENNVETEVRLCQHHLDRLEQETTPHED